MMVIGSTRSQPIHARMRDQERMWNKNFDVEQNAANNEKAIVDLWFAYLIIIIIVM